MVSDVHQDLAEPICRSAAVRSAAAIGAATLATSLLRPDTAGADRYAMPRFDGAVVGQGGSPLVRLVTVNQSRYRES